MRARAETGGPGLRVLYFDQYHHPENASGLHLVDDLLDGMAAEGWRVDLYVPVPTKGVDDATRAEYKRARRVESTRGGRVVVHRMPLFREGRNPAQRAARYLAFSLECLLVALRERYDVAFTGSGPPTQGWLVGLAARARKKPLVYNLQDVFPDSLANAGLARRGSLAWRLGRRIEDSSYRSAARIVTVSGRMRDNVLAKGADPAKVEVVYNWEDTDEVAPVPKGENRLFGELGVDPGLFHVVYAGNLGATQGLGALLDLADGLRSEEGLEFLVFGSGGQEAALKARAEGLALRNVRFFPLQPVGRVPEVSGMADVAFVSCRKGCGAAAFPSKAMSIFAAGRPVLASFDADSDLADVIGARGLGAVADPGDPGGLERALRGMLADRAALPRMGERAREYACECGSRANAVNKYMEIVEKAAGREGR